MRHLGPRGRHRRPRHRAPPAGGADAALLGRVGGPAVPGAPPGDDVGPPRPLGRRPGRARPPPGVGGHPPAPAVDVAPAPRRRRHRPRGGAARAPGGRPLAIRAPLGRQSPERHLPGRPRPGARPRPAMARRVHARRGGRPPGPADARRRRRPRRPRRPRPGGSAIRLESFDVSPRAVPVGGAVEVDRDLRRGSRHRGRRAPAGPPPRRRSAPPKPFALVRGEVPAAGR